jgi:hypothetical protein
VRARYSAELQRPAVDALMDVSISNGCYGRRGSAATMNAAACVASRLVPTRALHIR